MYFTKLICVLYTFLLNSIDHIYMCIYISMVNAPKEFTIIMFMTICTMTSKSMWKDAVTKECYMLIMCFKQVRLCM